MKTKLMLIFIALFFVVAMMAPPRARTYSGESVIGPAIFGCAFTTGSKIATDVYNKVVKGKPITEEERIKVINEDEGAKVCDERFPNDNEGFLECLKALKK